MSTIFTSFGSDFDQSRYLETYVDEHAPEGQKDDGSGKGMKPVDKDTARIFHQGFRHLGIKPRSIKGIAIDAMAGPSPFSRMLSGIYLADESIQQVVDFSGGNLVHQIYCIGNGSHVYEYVDVYGQTVKVDTHDPLWTVVCDSEIATLGQEVYMGDKRVDPALFTGTFERSRLMTEAYFGDVNELEREQFVLGTMFYGAESATNEENQMGHMLNAFFYSLEPGAPFVVVLSLESIGYPAGPHTWFPATYLEKTRVPKLIRQFGWPVTGKFYITNHSYREGHDGVGVLIGKRQLVLAC